MIYEKPLTRKETNIRYVLKYLASGRPLPHGKVWCYSKLGCRCDECRKAIREYQRKYEKANIPNDVVPRNDDGANTGPLHGFGVNSRRR
jgi:galactose-1-phosphate uridylyltransferase